MSGVVANKRNTESKYVSVFADSRPDVDVTFRDKLLDRPSDQFMVGVDNLTVSLNSLCMLDVDADTLTVIRIGHIRAPGAGGHYAHASSPQENIEHDDHTVTHATALPDGSRAEESLQSLETLPFFNVHQVMKRLRDIAATINERIKNHGISSAQYYIGYHATTAALDASPANNSGTHLAFELRPDGKLEVIGSRVFWANYFISLEQPKYQRIVDGARTDAKVDMTGSGPKFIGVMAGSGERYPVAAYGPRANGAAHVSFYLQGRISKNLAGTVVTEDAHGVPTYIDIDDAVNNANPNAGGYGAGTSLRIRGHIGADGYNPNAAAIIADRAYRYTKFRCVLLGNLWSTLDRRVALEMGCSLPVVNSPMIDHNKETPDFVLGRWMYNPRALQSLDTSGKNGETQIIAPSVVEYQNSTDRVQYHALMPQEKIQTIRLKMFVRVRTYDAAEDAFSMNVLECPTAKTDWWHTRLHFVSKD